MVWSPARSGNDGRQLHAKSLELTQACRRRGARVPLLRAGQMHPVSSQAGDLGQVISLLNLPSLLLTGTGIAAS